MKFSLHQHKTMCQETKQKETQMVSAYPLKCKFLTSTIRMTVSLKSKINLNGIGFLADWHTKVRLCTKMKFSVLIGKSLKYKTCYSLKAFFCTEDNKKHKSYIIAEYCLEYEKFAYIFCNITLQSSAKQVRRDIWGQWGFYPLTFETSKSKPIR